MKVWNVELWMEISFQTETADQHLHRNLNHESPDRLLLFDLRRYMFFVVWGIYRGYSPLASSALHEANDDEKCRLAIGMSVGEKICYGEGGMETSIERADGVE